MEDTESDLASALASESGPSPVSDACFVPSSAAEIGTWVAYPIATAASTPKELLLVNHASDASSIVVLVDFARDRVRVLSAPPDGSGAPAVAALLDDLSAYEKLDAAPASAGSVAPRGVIDGVGREVTLKLLARAAARLKTTSEALIKAVSDYTGDEYKALNKFLREGVAPEGWTKAGGQKKARTLSQAVQALDPVPMETRRWTKVGMNKDTGVDEAKLAGYLASLKPGRIYREKAFLSTSALPTAPSSVFTYTTFRFDIKGLSGRDISAFSNYPREAEVLFLPNTRFRVVSVEGQFVKTSWNGIPAEQWVRFVAAASEYFPGVTKSTIEREVAKGRVPNIIVKLEEIAAP